MKGITQIAAFAIIWTIAAIITFGLALLAVALQLWLILGGADRRAEKAEENLASTLMRDEELIGSGLQHRPFALWSRRVLIAITNSRVLVIKRGLFGGFKMLDIQWKDLQDVTIEQNVLSSLCGSNLTFKHSNRGVPLIAVDGIESDTASAIYSHSQGEEQAWKRSGVSVGLRKFVPLPVA